MSVLDTFRNPPPEVTLDEVIANPLAFATVGFVNPFTADVTGDYAYFNFLNVATGFSTNNSIEFMPDNTFYIGSTNNGRPQAIFVGTGGIWLSSAATLTSPVVRIYSDGTNLFNFTLGGWYVEDNTNPLTPVVQAQILTANNSILTLKGGVNPGNGTVIGGANPTIWGGSGVPAAALGVNGDQYIRSDTPGTALQRTYVKSGGAWVGVV